MSRIIQGTLDEQGNFVTPSKPIVFESDDSGGGGGSSQVEVTNFPTTQPVSGPLTNAQLTAVSGVIGAAAYTDDTGAANGTIIALLKGIYVQNATMIALLEDIKTNTATP